MKKFFAIALSALLIAGCSQDGSGPLNKQNVGAVLGGVGGAALGSNIGKGKGNIVGIAAGTLLGALVGSSVGASLDKTDRMYVDRTGTQALETYKSGTPAQWTNPDSGNSGTFTPLNVSQNSNGQYCREFRQNINVGGKTQEGYGTACRQPDGSWKILN